jgi:hypothetical protein
MLASRETASAMSKELLMSARPFRFGIVSALAPTADDWTSLARRA